MERRNFEDENKTSFLEWFLDDTDLCKALINNEKKYLDKPITQDQKDNLIFSQIFPYKFVPEITIAANSYITMDFSYSNHKKNELFLINNITVWVFCHRDLIRTQYKTLRYDFMKQRVSKILQDKINDNWFGRMVLEPPRETAIDENAKYYGVALTLNNQRLK